MCLSSLWSVLRELHREWQDWFPKVLGVYGLNLKLQVDSLWVNVGQQDVLSDFHSV